MAAQILLNGVDWTLKISEITPSVKENKRTDSNIRGSARMSAPRSSTVGAAVQITLPYLSAADKATLKALYDAKAAITLSTNLDIPSGSYIPVDYAQILVKTVDTTAVLYSVTLTLNKDTTPQVPAAVNSNSLLTVGQKLGL